MSQAEALLNTLDDSSIMTTADTGEGYIVINEDRTITVPDSLRRLGVQHDHNIETVTFSCPRFWDEHDMSQMCVYINYLRSDGVKGQYLATNLKVSGATMTFDWVISNNVTRVKGTISFLVCVVKTNEDGMEERHWNSELNQECYISEGMECQETMVLGYPDIITHLLLRMDATESVASPEAVQNATNEWLDANKDEILVDIETKAQEALDAIPSDYTEVYNLAHDSVRTRANAIVCSSEGDSIFVSDSSNDYLRGLKIFGKTKQVTTTGAQLAWTNINVADYPYLGVICSKTVDGNVSLNGVSTNNMWNRLASANLVAGETYTLSANKIISLSVWDVTADGSFTVKNAGKDSITFVAPNTGSYSLCIENVSGVVFADVRADIMLNTGETALPWEPYSDGIASPSPSSPQELFAIEEPRVSIFSKNLVNDILIGATSTQYSNCLLVEVDELKPNTTYTLSFIAAPEHKMYVNENLFSYQYVLGTGDRQSITITTKPIVDKTKDSHYTSGHWIILKNSEGNTIQPVFRDVQMELGTEATTYVANVPPQHIDTSYALHGLPVTKDGNYTDTTGQQWICDEIDFERGVYVQRIGRLTVDNSMTYYYNTDNFFLHTGSGLFDNVAAWETRILATHFIQVGNGISMSDYGWFQFNSNGGIRFRIEGIDSVDALTEWLRINTPEIIYPLLKPVETSLTAPEIEAFKWCHSNYPNTTILNDSRAYMLAKYNADTKTYVDERQPDLTDEQIRAAVDAWMSEHFTAAEGVSF